MSNSPDENADYTLQAQTKAVIFTHINLKKEMIEKKGPEAHVNEYISLFEKYLVCRNVGLVYMYISLGVEQVVKGVREVVDAVAEGRDLVIPPAVLMEEAICLDVLQLAEDKAREKYPNKPLRFVRVTTFQLVSLLRNLYEMDPNLIRLVRGKGGIYTYDSPKFVEAVIRIARGQDPRWARYPVVRFDEDVEVCEKSLDILLTAYERFLDTSGNPYFFFSGCYGDPNDPNSLDPINDRAVRVHYFVDKQFRCDSRKKRIDWSNNPKTRSMVQRIKFFWRDLGEVGATQLSDKAPPSQEGVNLIERTVHPARGFYINRDILQVISGAGLIMSLRAIQDLPPFANVNRLITWIDDYLKRQLHEMIGDIRSSELESVTEARFKQDRHPGCITDEDVAWAARDGGYLDALLAGCMMDSLISQPDEGNGGVRKPTEYALAIKKIITKPPLADEVKCESMESELREYATKRYEEVLCLWQTPEFDNTILHKWASAKKNDPKHEQKQVEGILEDACAYLELVKRWRVSFAAAIGRLKPIGNLWLFERVR